MKKPAVVLALLLIFTSGGYSLGTTLSLFFPQNATLSIEQGISHDFTLIKDHLDIPLALKYNKISGLYVAGDPTATTPWFYADALQLYAGLRGYIPITETFYFALEASGIVNWNVYLDALTGNIDRDLASSISGAQFASSDFTYGCKIGLGYSVGGGFGLRFGRFKLDLMANFLQARSGVTVSGDYRYVDSTGTVRTASYQSPDGAYLKLQGWKLQLGFSIAL